MSAPVASVGLGLCGTILLGMSLVAMPLQQDDEHPQITRSSLQFSDSTQSSLEKLKAAGFTNQLETPEFGATAGEQFNALVKAIRAETPVTDVSLGQRWVKYDVILQPGHYGRPPGPVGTSGQLVSERALVAYITNVIATDLRHDGNSVLVVSADRYLKSTGAAANFDGLTSTIFLAVHADGGTVPCKTGPSLGYSSNSSLLAMHAVGYGLSAALGYKYSDFNHDNFTVNEAQYYMFRQVRADRLTGILEIGELTCPNSEKDLISSADLIGRNVARALRFVVQTPTQ
jgi:N-acetylmuramoyl-L-alanine amidase